MTPLALYSHIEHEIAALPRPCVVGVDGGVTSGKSAFARNFASHLESRGHPVQLIHIDDFHNARAVRMKDSSPEHYLTHALDVPRFSALIGEIRRGPVNKTLTLRNMGTDDFTDLKTYKTDADTIVLVEGVYLCSAAICGLFDYKIFLDVDPDEILRRGRERDVPLYGEGVLQQYIDLFIPVHKLYLERYDPKGQSDLVIDNSDFRNPSLL